jgi:signal transduction histidine kinase
VSPVLDPAGNISGVASIKRDITHARRMEEALRQAAKMESIGRLAGGLAHDFNNHLHALNGFAHFVTRDPLLTPNSRRDLVQILKITERMATLTRQLLAFARQQVLNPEVVDLSAIVAEANPMLERLIGSTYALELEQDPGELWVRVDRAQLVQVLMNLVTNARDAMPEGGRVQVETRLVQIRQNEASAVGGVPVTPGTYAGLIVRDEGIGIPPDEISKVFEPFYTTKEVGQGTGLGLATVEGIVSQSKGYIQIRSAVNEGSTFRVLLPLSTPPTRP